MSAYVDGELGLDRAVEVEDHVATCLECRRRFEQERGTARMVREQFPRVALPEEVVWRILASLPTSSSWPMRSLGVGLAALVALLWVGWRIGETNVFPAPPRYVRDAVRIHEWQVRGTSLDLWTSDPEVATQWLRQRLPFLPDVVLRKPEKARLLGVAAVEIGGRLAGYARYRGADEAISLFLLPAGPLPASARSFSVRGVEFRVLDWASHRPVVWNHGSVAYILLATTEKDKFSGCAVCHASVTPFLPELAEVGKLL